MPMIVCEAKNCIHHDQARNCGVRADATIDVDSNGHCLDHSPITDDERMVLLGGGFDSK
jgi:hypothetical protein